MESTYRIGFAVVCPILGLLFHELTHIAVAKHQGSVSMKLISVFPKFRLELSYPDTQSTRGIRLMAISPFILGVVTAVAVLFLGIWQQIQSSVPYYIEGVLILSWLAYSHLSPADVRTILNPHRSTATS